MGVAHLFARIAHNRREFVCFESNPPQYEGLHALAEASEQQLGIRRICTERRAF